MLMDCTVLVAGQAFNDGSNRPPSDPSAVVLSGLSVTWGRSTTIDQPEPATCTFAVENWTADNGWLDTLRVGQSVAVDAAGIDTQTPTTGTYDDPDITRLAPIEVAADARRNVAVQLTADGAALTATGSTLTTGYWARLLPDDPSTAPSAWVTIPRMGASQEWRVRVVGRAPYGAICRLQALAMSSPTTSAGSIQLSGTHLVGAFDSLEPFRVPSHHDGRWAAIMLETYFGIWSGMAGTWAAQPQTWHEMATTAVTYADVYCPTDTRELSVRVFSGRITDVEAAWDASSGGLTANVTAADITSDMANRRVGAEPWPTEAADVRIGRIIDAADAAVTVRIDDGIGAYLIAAQDVDAQSPVALLDDVAASVDAVRWPASSELDGEYLWFENVSARPSGRALRMVGGYVVVTVDGTAQGALVLDACAVIRDPVTWRQDSADVITRVGMRWLELGVGTDGKPTETERTEWLTSPDAETVYGVRTLSVGTQLTTQADAITVGAAIAGRVWGEGWRIDGLAVIDADLADVGISGGLSPTVIMAELLDSTRRIGRMAELHSMPAWAPNVTSPDQNPVVYLEGGHYSYDGADWLLALVTSDSRGQGVGAAWADLIPEWRWVDFHPELTWAGIRGAIVAAPAANTPAYPAIAYPGLTYPGVSVWRNDERAD